ncbi:MAG TPA: hypothetical protein VMJ93_16000 [Verrucomicrobiae bacterium]|nr:hypothetical protein [Verrucomicrobiae bacterium]
MTGKRYYLTTLGAWQRHAHRFANSHWVAVGGSSSTAAPLNPGDATPIAVLVEADEGAHLALEDDTAFEPLPHPLSPRPLSASAQAALALHGVPAGATAFDASEALARLHPLLKYRVF